jgi:hypothetical protein
MTLWLRTTSADGQFLPLGGNISFVGYSGNAQLVRIGGEF